MQQPLNPAGSIEDDLTNRILLKNQLPPAHHVTWSNFKTTKCFHHRLRTAEKTAVDVAMNVSHPNIQSRTWYQYAEICQQQVTIANSMVNIVLDAKHVVLSQRLSQPTRKPNEFFALSAKILCRSQSTVTPFWFLPVSPYVSILRLARQTTTPPDPDPTKTELAVAAENAVDAEAEIKVAQPWQTLHQTHLLTHTLPTTTLTQSQQCQTVEKLGII